MNKKGELQAGAILVAFVAIIVAIALYTASLGFIGQTTNTDTLINSTVTLSATANRSTAITGQELITVLSVANRSTGTVVGYYYALDGSVLAEANVTLSECIDPLGGMKRVCIAANNADWVGRTVNVSYVYGPEGYIDSAGGRSLAGLIAIFAALAIAIIALVPTLRSGVMDMMGRD